MFQTMLQSARFTTSSLLRAATSGSLFAATATRGVKMSAHIAPIDRKKVEANAKEYLEKLTAGDRGTLARSITLIESLRPDKRAEGAAILAGIMQQMNAMEHELDPSKHSFRIGEYWRFCCGHCEPWCPRKGDFLSSLVGQVG